MNHVDDKISYEQFVNVLHTELNIKAECLLSIGKLFFADAEPTTYAEWMKFVIPLLADSVLKSLETEENHHENKLTMSELAEVQLRVSKEIAYRIGLLGGHRIPM